MKEMPSVKKASITALCIALCYVLPVAFHAFAIGSAISPIHIPVFICGLICGPAYGAFCGISGPFVSFLLTGMPTITNMISMVPELVVYGLVSGVLMRIIHTRSIFVDLYGSLIPAMLLGRITGGLASALFYSHLSSGEHYSFALWFAAYFAGTLPGILLQLIIIPTLILALMKAKVIPQRKAKEARS